MAHIFSNFLFGLIKPEITNIQYIFVISDKPIGSEQFEFEFW